MKLSHGVLLGLLCATVLAPSAPAFAAGDPAPVLNPTPTAKDWADLAKLPDWNGVWVPDALDQNKQRVSNPPPWNEKAAAKAKFQADEQKAGRPDNFFSNCLPEAMPAWMLVTHNSMQFAITPGIIYMLGESDGSRLRRIYTDGRPHPDDPDLTLHGHSIGHWEGDTLLVDTVGFNGRNQNISEKMHITERIHLDKDGTLVDDMTLDDPNIYTQPYTVTTRYRRASGQEANELQEYDCEVDPNNLFAYLAEQKAAGRPVDFNPGWAASNYNNPASVADAEAKKDK